VPQEAHAIVVLISIARTVIRQNIDVCDLVIKGVDKLNFIDVWTRPAKLVASPEGPGKGSVAIWCHWLEPLLPQSLPKRQIFKEKDGAGQLSKAWKVISDLILESIDSSLGSEWSILAKC
jgi:hypothetical protein